MDGIEGLKLTPLRIIESPLGDVYHALKNHEDSFSQFGEAYFSTVVKDQVKGWKKHTKMVLNVVVPVGEIQFVVYDDRPNSTTSGQFVEIKLSKANYQRLTVPTGVWMAFKGIGPDQNMLLNIASIPHDPEEAINLDLENDVIPYVWK
ncbi:MAG: dTDP-4-dehydrorhamnose 3,5-epimerase family protein [Bacteroidia bacterium]|nr:dTDP-4-dehydrorhamnose 3,5-epimerase family protein [Bacteroidia bacterium]